MALQQNYDFKGTTITNGYFRIDRAILTHYLVDSVKTYKILLSIGLYSSNSETETIDIFSEIVTTTDESKFSMAYMYGYLKTLPDYSSATDV